jgi:hypothetical protein
MKTTRYGAEDKRRAHSKPSVYWYQLGTQVDPPVKQELCSSKSDEQQSIEYKTNGHNTAVRDSESGWQIELLKSGVEVGWTSAGYEQLVSLAWNQLRALLAIDLPLWDVVVSELCEQCAKIADLWCSVIDGRRQAADKAVNLIDRVLVHGAPPSMDSGV